MRQSVRLTPQAQAQVDGARQMMNEGVTDLTVIANTLDLDAETLQFLLNVTAD